jgi:uncharacterized phiE125 gp8 family phage protein
MAAQAARIFNWTSQEAVLSHCIDAATAWIENYTGRALMRQTWTYTLHDGWSAAVVLLPRAPVIEVISIATFSSAGVETVVDPASYYVDILRAPGQISLLNTFVYPSDLRATNGVVITYDAGYGDDPALVPVPMIQAIYLLVGYWYSHREAAQENDLSAMEFGVKALVDPYRVTV